MLASRAVKSGQPNSRRSLLVLADGAQTAFAAGAVAELARRGTAWAGGAGGGLGAQVGILAVLGEAAEAERRWLRDAELGSLLLRSRLAAYREVIGPTPGATLTADAWTLAGWLDPGSLAEHLAPEMAALPERLSRSGRSFALAVEDVERGTTEWVELSRLGAGEAGAMLRAAATFPAGWGPETLAYGGSNHRVWGGVGAAIACTPPWVGRGDAWDIVCGFPVPVLPRSAVGGSLLELIQRREEARAGGVAAEWPRVAKAGSLRLIAPAAEAYREWAERDSADLGVEYPLPWERNGELTVAVIDFGASAAAHALAEESSGTRTAPQSPG